MIGEEGDERDDEDVPVPEEEEPDDDDDGDDDDLADDDALARDDDDGETPSAAVRRTPKFRRDLLARLPQLEFKPWQGSDAVGLEDDIAQLLLTEPDQLLEPVLERFPLRRR